MAQRPSTGNWHSNRAKGSSLAREHYLKNLNPHPARGEVFHSLSAPRSGMGMPTEPQSPLRPASSFPRSCVAMHTEPQTPPRPAPRSHAPAWQCIPSRKAHRALPLVPTLLRGNAYQAAKPTAPYPSCPRSCVVMPTDPHTHQPHYHWRHTSNKPATLA